MFPGADRVIFEVAAEGADAEGWGCEGVWGTFWVSLSVGGSRGWERLEVGGEKVLTRCRRANEVVERRLKSGEKGRDMVQSFVDAGMSQFEVKQEMYVEM